MYYSSIICRKIYLSWANKISRMFWVSAPSNLIITYKSIQQGNSTNRELNGSKRTVIEEDINLHNKLKNRSLQSVDTFNNKISLEPDTVDRETFAGSSGRNSSNLLSTFRKGQQYTLQQTIKQDVQELNQPQKLDIETIEVTSAAEKVVSDDNLTADEKQMRHFWMRKKLLVEAQFAYISIVFLICLMLVCFWWMRGFHMRHETKVAVSFNNELNLLTVKDVLFMRARYLPMFHRKDELREVFIHDCGNDP